MKAATDVMNTTRQERIKQLLIDALERQPAQRTDFVNRAAADDSSIAAEVHELLGAHERATEFLIDPTLDGSAFGDRAIGRYSLLKVLGEGGFGRVYLAEQREPVQRSVAVKVIKPGMDTRQVISRFEAERQALAMMKHPGIAAVLDAGATSNGQPYFVMEYVEGVSITDYCDEHCLSVEDRLNLFIQVCGAVQHAHTKGVIHRDLKPSNLLVTVQDGQPQPKVIDFGIAKAVSGRLTDSTISIDGRGFVGTPQYMSPEQAAPGLGPGMHAIDIDTRTDVYSLGVVLYELLAGASPFDNERLSSAGAGQWQRIIREEEPPKPSTRLSSLGAIESIAACRGTDPRHLPTRINGDLDWITLKAIEKDRDRRYGSPAELAEDLKRHLNHEPVVASPPSTAYLMKKFVRRHRVGVIASSLIALALACGAVGLTVGTVQARDSAQEARVAAEQAQAVNDFMGQILTSVKPEMDGADVRLFEVMDKASQTASERFAGHALLEAQVRDLLGGVYADLTMSGKAKNEFKRAMELWQTYSGPDDPRTLTSERQYVGSAINNLQIAEVESRLPSLLERTRRVFGEGALATLSIYRAVGVAHMMRGRLDEAERILLEVRAQLFRLGDDDEQQILTAGNLIRLGKMRSSGAAYEVRAAMVMQLEPLAREMVDRAVRAHGPASLMAQEARTKWANMLADQRRYAEAARQCREILSAASDRLGECHSIKVETFNTLAEAAHFQGDSALAAELKLKLIECARQTGSAMNLVVEISDALPMLERGGRWAEGEALAREFIDALIAMGGGHGDMTFDANTCIARFVSLQSRLDEAEALFADQLAQADDFALAPNVRSRVHLYHGGNLWRLGKFEAAETEIQSAAELVSDFRMGTRNMTPDDILLEFIALYSAWGKPELANEYERLRQETLANLPMDPS